MTNAEKFKNVDSRERGFLLFCNKHNEDGSCVKCPLNNKAKKRLGCAYAWLDLEAEEAEEEKPMDCPVCGCHCGYRWTVILCMNNACTYGCGFANHTKKMNCTKHNRICKAVAAYKESEVK